MAESDRTVLVVTREDPRFHCYSPTLPGFVFGAPNAEEFWRDVGPAVVWAGGKPDLTVYIQRPYETPEGVEWLLRVLQDDHLDERLEIAQRIHASITATEQRHQIFDNAVATRTGEYVFHCALFSDTVRSVVQALRPSGDAVVVAAAVAEGLWYAEQVTTGEPGPDEQRFSDLGLTLDSTVKDLMEAKGGDAAGTENLRPSGRTLVLT